MSAAATQFVDSLSGFEVRRIWSMLRSLLGRACRADPVPDLPAGLALRDAGPRERAPHFTLPRVGGCDCSLSDFAGRRLLLVFVHPDAEHSRNIGERLNHIHRSGELQVLVVAGCRPHEAGLWADDVLAVFPVAVQSDRSLSANYDVSCARYAFVIDPR